MDEEAMVFKKENLVNTFLANRTARRQIRNRRAGAGFRPLA
jgi:hypothetical protein